VAISRRSGRSRFTLILLILTSATLLTLDYRGFGPLESARDSVLSALAPVKDVVGDATSPVSDAWNGAFHYGDLEAENEELREQLRTLEGERFDAARDTETLRRMLGEVNIPYVGDNPKQLAEVVSGPVGNFDNTIEIATGSDDGVAEGMSVVSSSGLVGIVERVTSDRSEVLLVTAPDFEVGVRLTRSADAAVAFGQGQGRPLTVEGVPAEVAVQRNELVTTGVDRSRYPAGIPVGLVSSTEVLDGELDRELFVEPIAHLNDLHFVTVILWLPDA
jgi:rod shape-determining protein MreC